MKYAMNAYVFIVFIVITKSHYTVDSPKYLFIRRDFSNLYIWVLIIYVVCFELHTISYSILCRTVFKECIFTIHKHVTLKIE